MSKKQHRMHNGQKHKDDEYRITNQMPAWMRQMLSLEGIARKFKIHKLTPYQRYIVDLACHLNEMHEQGLLEITFDPKINPEPLVALTEKGVREYT
jgi:hypothetical protein